jgi:hypothetical protein
MAERTSDDVSLAAALESDPLPPETVSSGVEGLPLVPSGSISPTTSSPPAGVQQTATSRDNDEYPSVVPSRPTQQPPTSGDGVHAPEQVMSLSSSGSTRQDVTGRGGRVGQDPQGLDTMPPASGTTSPSPSLRFNSSTSSSSLQHQVQGVDIHSLRLVLKTRT